MKEVEAKFLAKDPLVFEQVLSHQWLGGYELKFKERQLLVTDYFDTDQWDLLKARSVLRLRRCGRECTLCMKKFLRQRGVIQAREEYEDVLEEGYPKRIDDVQCATMEKVRKITDSRPLLLVLTVENNRTVTELVRNARSASRWCLTTSNLSARATSGGTLKSKWNAPPATNTNSMRSGFELEPSTVSKFERGLRLTRIWPPSVEW